VRPSYIQTCIKTAANEYVKISNYFSTISHLYGLHVLIVVLSLLSVVFRM
jgi:hypothetical protein